MGLRHVFYIKELSSYHFPIDYYDCKANRAVNALSQYPQRSAEEQNTLQVENAKILHWLQSLLA